MAAGFDFGDEVFMGTNGSIAAYVEALGALAATRFGADHRMAVFFRSEAEGFFPGKIVFLDEVLQDGGDRALFVELLDAATEELLAAGGFTDIGREWVAREIPKLRAHVSAG